MRITAQVGDRPVRFAEVINGAEVIFCTSGPLDEAKLRAQAYFARLHSCANRHYGAPMMHGIEPLPARRPDLRIVETPHERN